MTPNDEIRVLVEKRINHSEKMTDDEMDTLQANGYFFSTYWGVCDIIKNGTRVGKAIRDKSNNYKIKWF